MFTENLDIFLADHSVPCAVGTFTFKGIFETPAQVAGVGHIQSVTDELTVLIKASDLAVAIATAGWPAITVNGTAFTVRERLPIDDGAFVHLTLKH